MGGLSCHPDLGGEADHRAVEVVRAMTTAFLDACLKDDGAAQAYLQTVDVPAATDGFARYEHRSEVATVSPVTGSYRQIGCRSIDPAHGALQ